MSFRKRNRPIQDPGRRRLHEVFTDQNIGPFSGKRTGKIPRPRRTPVDVPAPPPQRRDFRTRSTGRKRK